MCNHFPISKGPNGIPCRASYEDMLRCRKEGNSINGSNNQKLKGKERKERPSIEGDFSLSSALFVPFLLSFFPFHISKPEEIWKCPAKADKANNNNSEEA